MEDNPLVSYQPTPTSLLTCHNLCCSMAYSPCPGWPSYHPDSVCRHSTWDSHDETWPPPPSAQRDCLQIQRTLSTDPSLVLPWKLCVVDFWSIFLFQKFIKYSRNSSCFFLTVFLDLEFIYLKESPCHTWSRARLRPAPGNPSHTSPPPPPCTPCPGWSHHTRCTRDPLFWSPSHRLEDLCRWDTCPPPAPHTPDTENICMCQSNILTCSTKMPQK